MRSNEEQYQALIGEFPELSSPDVILRKEILAHFGLLFSRFADLEASLQNGLIFFQLRDRLRSGWRPTAEAWEAAFNDLEAASFSLTLGNLIRRIKRYPEYASEFARLDQIKPMRDYFAHHFFREELENILSENGMRALLVGINRARLKVKASEDACGQVADQTMKAIFRDQDLEGKISVYTASLRQDAEARGASTPITHGWEKYLDP